MVAPERLRLQVFRRSWLDRLRVEWSSMVHTEIAEGVLGLVVEDSGGGERTLRRSEVAHLGDDARLLQLGRMNSSAAEAAGVKLQQVGPAIVSASNGFYLAGPMLDLVEASGPAGALAAIVTWHHWVLLPLEPPRTTRADLAALQRVVALVAEGALSTTATGADRIGSEVFWFQGKRPGWRVDLGAPPPALATLIPR